MNHDTYLIAALIISGFALLAWLINRRGHHTDSDQQALIEWLKSTTQTLQQSDKNVTDTLLKSYQEMNQRLDIASKVIGELKLETGKFSEIGRSMQDLQDYLNSPKLRGNLGEQVLSDLLAQVLPRSAYKTQHRFKSGHTVDVVIKTQAGLIPIDSKFPLENFSKMMKAESQKEAAAFKKLFVSDVKRHIKTIAEKYIKTNEGTVDFALVYIPSESVYYEIMTQNDELPEYAQNLRVLAVSPATFYAFLRTILVSFEGQRIATEAQAILNNLRDIQKASGIFGEHLELLGKHVTNAYKNMNDVSEEFRTLQGKIHTTQSLSSGNHDNQHLPKET